MARSGVTLLSFAVMLAVIQIGSCLRCYQCNSQSNRECMDPFQTSATVDCSSQSMYDYNRNYLSNILPPKLIETVTGGPKQCAKIVLQTGTVVRTCLDINPNDPDQTCRYMKTAANAFSASDNKQFEHCSVCDRDNCNGAGSITASIPVAVLALVASYLFYKQ